eukprot:COSAG02_NODE_1894_length_10475_cov_10.204125_2_plen_206_part_00
MQHRQSRLQLCYKSGSESSSNSARVAPLPKSPPAPNRPPLPTGPLALSPPSVMLLPLPPLCRPPPPLLCNADSPLSGLPKSGCRRTTSRPPDETADPRLSALPPLPKLKSGPRLSPTKLSSSAPSSPPVASSSDDDSAPLHRSSGSSSTASDVVDSGFGSACAKYPCLRAVEASQRWRGENENIADSSSTQPGVAQGRSWKNNCR